MMPLPTPRPAAGVAWDCRMDIRVAQGTLWRVKIRPIGLWLKRKKRYMHTTNADRKYRVVEAAGSLSGRFLQTVGVAFQIRADGTEGILVAVVVFSEGGGGGGGVETSSISSPPLETVRLGTLKVSTPACRSDTEGTRRQ